MRRMGALAGLLALALLSSTARAQTTMPQLFLNEIVGGLNAPIFLTAPANDSRLFIVERPGRIRIFENGVLLPTPFLNITGKTDTTGEGGLLSFAFHPKYAENGHFYVNYTTPGARASRIERYTVSPTNPNVADPASARLILQIDQPFTNHNGGLNAFGPDGKLYIAMGDGGSANDPQNNAQNRANLLGDMLRIDVDNGDPYAIPADNPFVGQAGIRPEIWAYGLRNPWRFAFDFTDNQLYIADVGQNEWEEIHIEPSTQGGQNYGWKIMEGQHCFSPASGCNQTGLTLPPVEYNHSEGCSITGGYVYRGEKIPEIAGHYFYSDYCNGWIRSFKYANAAVTEKRQWSLPSVGNIVSFGEDAQKNLYVLSFNGRVYRLANQDNLKGDVTRDERVNVTDAILVLRSSVGNATLTSIQRTLGNVNGDANVDVSDAVLILQHAVGIITQFPQ
ncbi:MAG: PQQ-dependent sugar dehydrogenase [Armatimonadetes bacterium]|nr:PQQ-dependent sugar dehydrogenase [Armatimonadota bacterium]